MGGAANTQPLISIKQKNNNNSQLIRSSIYYNLWGIQIDFSIRGIKEYINEMNT